MEEKVICVSCGPATLARGLAILCRDKYCPLEAQPVGMFPQIFHIESVSVLERGPA